MASSSGVILGDWTHRRANPGGTRALSAEVSRAKPEIAWTWRPQHDGPVDQVRIAGACVYVATMMPRDDMAPGWEHAIIYALDARTGEVIARRTLPDPAPVAAMVVDAGSAHVVSTRRGEPIFWYALQAPDLVPRYRKILELDRDARHEDVLDAWIAPDGGMWLELEGALGGARGRAYAFASNGETLAIAQTHEDDIAAADWGSPARDACCEGHVLFAPLAGRWRDPLDATAPALWKVEPKLPEPGLDAGAAARAARVGHAQETPLTPPAQKTLARSEVTGPRARVHAMTAEGVVCGVAVAQDTERDDRAVFEAFAVDRTSEVERWRLAPVRIALRGALGEGARLARRPNGELLFQSLRNDGTPCSDLICASAGGQVETVALGNGGRYILDAALGDLVLAHQEGKRGRVSVSAFDIDRASLPAAAMSLKNRLLGRRSAARWTVETEDLGGSVTVYAGAGHVVVRGARGIAAIRV